MPMYSEKMKHIFCKKSKKVKMVNLKNINTNFTKKKKFVKKMKFKFNLESLLQIIILSI